MSNLQKQTVLVVDDLPDNIILLDAILRDEFDVCAATNGEAALEIAGSAAPPDIVLLDVMMPGMDGFEVCRRLKEQSSTRHIPVIFVTAMGEIQNEALGFEVGAADYLHKPVSAPIVQARVRTQLAIYDQTRELDRRVRERTAELKQTRFRVIRQLGRAGEFRDNETGLHVIRVGHYCRLLGQAAKMHAEDVEMFFDAAPLHDIGKIGIRDSILLKPGKLDDEEFDIMKTHTAIGAEILGERTSDLHDMAREIAMTHHEKWNGAGYPNGLIGNDIPLVGRVTAIADVFDALTSERPYKKAWSTTDAAAHIAKEAGAHFDPRLVAHFQAILPQILQCRDAYADLPLLD